MKASEALTPDSEDLNGVFATLALRLQYMTIKTSTNLFLNRLAIESSP